MLIHQSLAGRKETRIGARRVVFGAGDSLIVSHSLPVVAAITEAAPDTPYVAMILSIDLGIARSLHNEIGDLGSDQDAQSAIASKTAPELIDAFARFFRASRDPVEAAALAPLIIREIHFRLLQADHGGMLCQMLWRDSAASKVGRVMNRMRTGLADPLSVPEMASIAGMSVSAFHEHFKAIAGTSPLHRARNCPEPGLPRFRLGQVQQPSFYGVRRIALGLFRIAAIRSPAERRVEANGRNAFLGDVPP